MATPEGGKAVVGSFLRRFSRLSAKTRSKYRNELRRSNSLLDLRSHHNSENSQNSTPNDAGPSENALSEWIGRRLRARQRDPIIIPDGESELENLSQSESSMSNNSEPKSETYVGNTLLKEKPRLRVRTGAVKSATLGNAYAEKTDYDPKMKSPTSKTLPTSKTSSSELSDMEQVLFRAARLRSRRVRSASNETRGTDRTSQEFDLKTIFYAEIFTI